MLGRAYHWYLHARRLGFVIFAASMLYAGHGISQAVANLGGHSGVEAETITHTLPGATRTESVTVRLPGKVIRRIDHVLVVRTPRYVFVYHGLRRVIKPKTVRIRFSLPIHAAPPVIAAVLNQGTPATVTVPVTVPGPTTTITGPTTTVTLPQATTTVTVPVTITVPLTLTSG